MTQAETKYEHTADSLIRALSHRGIDSLVYQTSPEVATIYASMPNSILFAGPGDYNNENPGTSVFNTGSMYVSTIREDDPGVVVLPGSTADQVADLFVAAGG